MDKNALISYQHPQSDLNLSSLTLLQQKKNPSEHTASKRVTSIYNGAFTSTPYTFQV